MIWGDDEDRDVMVAAFGGELADDMLVARYVISCKRQIAPAFQKAVEGQSDGQGESAPAINFQSRPLRNATVESLRLIIAEGSGTARCALVGRMRSMSITASCEAYPE